MEKMIINWKLQANLSIDVCWPRQLYAVVSIAGMPQNGKFIIEKHTKKQNDLGVPRILGNPHVCCLKKTRDGGFRCGPPPVSILHWNFP